MKASNYLLFFAIFFLVSACTFTKIKKVPGGGSDAVTLGKDQKLDFAWVQENVINSGRCLNCHTAGAQAADLTTYAAVMAAKNSRGQPYVVAGAPKSSLLFTSLDSGAMPKNGARLNQTRIDGVALWIEQGAFEGVQKPVDNEDLNAELTFKSLSKEIFEPRCNGCHSSQGEAFLYDFTTYEGIMHEVDLVNPEKSRLYTFVIPRADGRPPAMPEKAAPLTKNQTDKILKWIKEGAKENPSTSLNFKTLSTKIFEPRCNSCHGVGGDADYLDFSDYKVLMSKVNLADPKNSRLYKAVLSGRMPQNQTKLKNEDIALILTWIEQGAQQ